MNEGVDDDLADRLNGDGVDIAAAHFSEDGGLVSVLQQELHGLVNGQRHRSVDLNLVEDVRALGAAQPAALNPGGGQETRGVGARSENPCVGRNDLIALSHCKTECQQIIRVGGAAAQLGQSAQIQVSQGGAWLGQVLKSDAMSIAFELGNQCRIGLASGGTETHVDARFWPLPSDVVGASGAQRNIDDENSLVGERDKIDGGNQLWRDPVIDETGDALLLGERVLNTDHGAIIRDPDNEATTRGVREGCDGTQWPRG